MHLGRETIVAIATPPGRGGIGVVRLSGPHAREIASPMLRLQRPLEPGKAQFGYLLSTHGAGSGPPGEVLDEVLATFFEAPHSYTGEDVLEVSTHGSPVVLDAVVRACLDFGARLAQPGEFTERAFLSGRLDLIQAEAVNDLIQSTTLHQARTAASQMGGALSRTVAPLKERLITLIATLEAGIDFAEDDIDLLSTSQISDWIDTITRPLATLEQSYAYGRVIRDGFQLAIVGRPNAGKSSLFNALLRRERAIVTPAPGTTRDLVTDTIAMDGIPVELVDTAGLRTHDASRVLDEAETLGIAKSRQVIAEADVVLLVIDGTLPPHAEDLEILESGGDTLKGRLIVALNKCDLFTQPSEASDAIAANSRRVRLDAVDTSARSGTGLPELQAAILSAVRDCGATLEGGLLTSLRQHRTVQGALDALRAARYAVEAAVPHEVFLLDLQHGLRAMDELTGSTTTDDILQRIFSTFCIGK